MKLKDMKVGMEVRVKKFKNQPEHWNESGKMNHWMGKKVTIKRIVSDLIYPVRIREDSDENLMRESGGWSWKPSDFEPIKKRGKK